LFCAHPFETDRRDCAVSFKSPLSFDGGSAPKLDFGFAASGGGGVSAKLSMSLDELVKSNKAAAKAVPAGKSRETKALDKAAQTKEKRNKAVAEKRGVAPTPTPTAQQQQTKQTKKDGKPAITTSNQRKRAREKKKRAEERAQRAAAADAAVATGAGAASNGTAAVGAGAKQRPQKPKQSGAGQPQQSQQPQQQQQQQQQQRQKTITIQVKNDRAAPAGGNKNGDRKHKPKSGAERGAPKANGGGAKLQQKQQERVVRQVSTTKDARQTLQAKARQHHK
jgi:hypothetical protein